MPYDMDIGIEPPTERIPSGTPVTSLVNGSIPAEVYSLFENLNGELLRQKIGFETELKRTKDSMNARITKLESELEQRDADCKSLQNSVTILGRSVDSITEAIEKVVPTLPSTSPLRTGATRGRSPGGSQRGASPVVRPSSPKAVQKRMPSPIKRSASNDTRRSNTPTRKNSVSPITEAPYSRLKVSSSVSNQPTGGAIPVISTKRGHSKGATAVREMSADYVAGIRYPPFLQSSVFPPQGMENLQGAPSKLPNAKLDLQHIYGCSVSGYDESIAYADAGRQVIFYAAGVGVSLNVKNRRQSFSFYHTSEISCMAVHPSGNFVATGQKGSNPFITVWDTKTMMCKANLKDFHETEISCVAFSPDGSILASVGGDNDHSIATYRWETNELVAHNKLSTEAIYNISFNPYNSKVMMAVGRHTVKYIEICSVASRLTLKVRSGITRDVSLSHQRVVCSAYIDQYLWVTGTDSGNLILWRNEKVLNAINEVHVGGVSSIRCTGNCVISSGRDGNLRLWQGADKIRELLPAASTLIDIASLLKKTMGKSKTELAMQEALRLVTTSKAPVRSMDVKGSWSEGLKVLCLLFSNQIIEINISEALNNGTGISVLSQGHSSLPTSSLKVMEEAADVRFENSISAVAVHPKYPIAATVASDQTLRFWDIMSFELAHVAQLPGRGLCIDFSPDGTTVAVGLEAGLSHKGGKPSKGGAAIYQISANQHGAVRSCKLTTILSESEGDNSYCVKFDPSGQRVAVAGGLCRVDIFDIMKGYKRVAHTKGHNSEITRLDWSADGSHIQTDDQTPEHLYFTRDGMRVTRPVQIRSQVWSKWTCAFGWHIQGVWDDSMNRQSITAVDRSGEGDLCAAGDSSNNVSLFSFPIPMQQASHKKYRGHSSEVTSVTFSPTDSSMLSAATDGCIFQWTVLRK